MQLPLNLTPCVEHEARLIAHEGMLEAQEAGGTGCWDYEYEQAFKCLEEEHGLVI